MVYLTCDVMTLLTELEVLGALSLARYLNQAVTPKTQLLNENITFSHLTRSEVMFYRGLENH